MNKCINKILALSLLIIPLAGSFTIGPVIAITNITNAKEFLIIILVLSIGILSLINRDCEGFACCTLITPINWPLYALILFLPVSIYCSPPIKLMFFKVNMGGAWLWKPIVWIFLYWMLYESVIRIDFNKDLIVKAIKWSALITVVYACLQILGLDQFQFVRDYYVIGQPAARHITGMIGCPTYLAIWLVMCFPFILAYARWPWWILTGSVIIACKSDIGIAGLVLMALCWPAFRARRDSWLWIIAICLIIGVLAVAGNWGVIRPYITDNGRFKVWKAAFEDWKAPAILMEATDDMTIRQRAEVQILNNRTYALTGRGLGSFAVFFGAKYNSAYDTAHNEHLEIPYVIGLIGYTLFMAAAGIVLWGSFKPARGDRFLSACYLSFLYSFIAAFGISLWQFEPLRFLSAMMFIFLSSKSVKRETLLIKPREN